MSRLLFWLALIVLVLMALRAKFKERAPGSTAPGPRDTGGADAASETMCCCAHCGIYFPASEALRSNGLDYCSPAHVGLPAK